MAQVNGIVVWTEGIKAELAKRLPKQRKTQWDKRAVLVATMLHVRSANLVELAAGLPRESDRWDMGYQWISRFLANDLVCCDTVMEPFAREILARLAETGEPIPLILDQTTASDRHQILMLSVRWGERALPLVWELARCEFIVAGDNIIMLGNSGIGNQLRRPVKCIHRHHQRPLSRSREAATRRRRTPTFRKSQIAQ